MDHGFILTPTYRVEDDQAFVQLFGKLENGETFLVEVPMRPYFFIRAADVDRAKHATEIEEESVPFTTLSGEPVVRVPVAVPQEIPRLRGQLVDAGIPCFEADIRFPYRYLIDKRLTGDISIRGTYEQGSRVNRVYHNPTVLPGDWHGTLVTLSLDIETDTDGTLWSVSLATKDRKEALIIGKDAAGATRVVDERALLTQLSSLIRDINPDIITGWNIIDFDLRALRDKYAQHDIIWDWGRSSRPCSVRVYEDFLRESTADIPGRVVLDGIHLLRTSFIKLDNYTLEHAAQHFLGRGKLFTGKDRHADIKRAYEHDPDQLIAYNMNDAQLVLDILEKTGVVELAIERSKITGMPLDRVKASIASLDMVYLPRLHERGIVAPSVGNADKQERITGGYVMESKPGIYDYVIVCDFKSLYPSVMRTLNIDPWAYRPTIARDVSDDAYIVAENGAVFTKELGILPGILQELWEQRDAARKKGDELGRYAIKILMNSFFGVLASPNCRFFSMDVANAITHTCRYVIMTTAKHITAQGYDVLYSDTDSAFIHLAVDSEEEATRVGRSIEREVNTWLDAHIQERYGTTSYLELEFEKTFIKFLMPKTRSGEGSKKRYAGLVRKNGNKEVQFTGLEFVRRDWTELAKDFQLGILDRIFRDQDPQSFIREFVEKLKNGTYDKKLIYRKALRKPLDEYTKTTPPHVKAARLLETLESNIIEYVQTVDGPEPVQQLRHSIDYQHYMEKQLEPIADSILGFYDTTFDDVLRGTSQKGLFEF